MSNPLLLFIHIPKTAGTSFFDALSQRFSSGAIAPYSDEEVMAQLAQPNPSINTTPYRLMRTHATMSITAALPSNIRYITMLRDPVKRVLSLYNFVKYVPNSSPMHAAVKDMTLDEFLDYQDGRHTTNRQVRALAGDLGGTPTAPHLPLTDHAYLDAALANLERFAFIGLVEDYTLSMQLLAYTFGWPPFEPTKNLNVTPPTPNEPIPEQTMQRLRQHVALDEALYYVVQKRFYEQIDDMAVSLIDKQFKFPGLHKFIRRLAARLRGY